MRGVRISDLAACTCALARLTSCAQLLLHGDTALPGCAASPSSSPGRLAVTTYRRRTRNQTPRIQRLCAGLCPKLAMSALCGECPRQRRPEHHDACSPAAAAVDCGVHCAPRNNVPVRVLLHTESAEVQSVALRRSPRRCRGSFVNTGGTRAGSSSDGQCTRRRHVAAASTADGTPLHLKKWGLCCWCGPPPACKTHSLRIGVNIGGTPVSPVAATRRLLVWMSHYKVSSPEHLLASRAPPRRRPRGGASRV